MGVAGEDRGPQPFPAECWGSPAWGILGLIRRPGKRLALRDVQDHTGGGTGVKGRRGEGKPPLVPPPHLALCPSVLARSPVFMGFWAL